jgi:hypothetical protein
MGNKIKSPEQKAEDISFMATIKNSVNDWDTREKTILKLYHSQSAIDKKDRAKWENILKSELPENLELLEWKRFIGLRVQERKSKVKDSTPIEEPVVIEIPTPKESPYDRSLFPQYGTQRITMYAPGVPQR